METDIQYLLRRAEEEDMAANSSPNQKIRDLHSELAVRYREAAQGGRPLKSPELSRIRSGLPDEFRILE